MTLNTEIFYPGAKVAVNCKTEEEAREFLDAVIEAYPDQVGLWGSETRFVNFGSDTTFVFRLASEIIASRHTVMYGRVKFYYDSGFVVVTTTDVLVGQYKVPEIEANFDIKFLFGALEVVE